MRTSSPGRSPTAQEGFGSFSTPMSATAVGAKEVADLNGDGLPDLAAFGDDGSLRVYLQQDERRPRGAVHLPGHGVAGWRRRDLDGRPHGGRRRRHRRCRCRRHLGRRVDLPAADRRRAAADVGRCARVDPLGGVQQGGHDHGHVPQPGWRLPAERHRVARALGARRRNARSRPDAGRRGRDRSASRTCRRPPARTTTRWCSPATPRTRARRARPLHVDVTKIPTSFRSSVRRHRAVRVVDDAQGDDARGRLELGGALPAEDRDRLAGRRDRRRSGATMSRRCKSPRPHCPSTGPCS